MRKKKSRQSGLLLSAHAPFTPRCPYSLPVFFLLFSPPTTPNFSLALYDDDNHPLGSTARTTHQQTIAEDTTKTDSRREPHAPLFSRQLDHEPKALSAPSSTATFALSSDFSWTLLGSSLSLVLPFRSPFLHYSPFSISFLFSLSSFSSSFWEHSIASAKDIVHTACFSDLHRDVVRWPTTFYYLPRIFLFLISSSFLARRPSMSSWHDSMCPFFSRHSFPPAQPSISLPFSYWRAQLPLLHCQILRVRLPWIGLVLTSFLFSFCLFCGIRGKRFHTRRFFCCCHFLATGYGLRIEKYGYFWDTLGLSFSLEFYHFPVFLFLSFYLWSVFFFYTWWVFWERFWLGLAFLFFIVFCFLFCDLHFLIKLYS